jgi:hypothetical protein
MLLVTDKNPDTGELHLWIGIEQGQIDHLQTGKPMGFDLHERLKEEINSSGKVSVHMFIGKDEKDMSRILRDKVGISVNGAEVIDERDHHEKG